MTQEHFQQHLLILNFISMKFSLTIAGLVASAIGMAFQQAGIGFEQTQIDNFIYVGTQLVGILVAGYGRFRQGDINLFGKKK